VGALAWPLLVAVFLAGAAATWAAGVVLSRTTDALDVRLNLGDELGGVVLLAVAGSLPELAITVAAAAGGNLGLAARNLSGGIAVQTLVLTLCDFAVGSERPLTFLVGRLTPVLEGLLVVLVVTGVVMGGLLPASASVGPVSVASLAIVGTWIAGVYVIDRVRKGPRWQLAMPGSRPGRRHVREPHPDRPRPFASSSTTRVATLLGAACAVTLVAGVALEMTGDALADRAGINGVVFGATALAAATALPEISSGIAAARMGDHALAVGDVFGGNAFQVCLFPVADLVAGQPVLPTAGPLNSWLAALGIALSGVYTIGIVARPTRTFARLGPDSLVALLVFALGIVGLVVLQR
jgi:cation:H+ antiporter